jgi:hypothetical protein
MSDLQLFTDRVRSFARTRRLLLDAALSYGLGTLALLAGTMGLVCLSGIIPNPWVNLAIASALALFWLVLLVVGALRWARRRPPLDDVLSFGVLVLFLAAGALGVVVAKNEARALGLSRLAEGLDVWVNPVLFSGLALCGVAGMAVGALRWKRRRPPLEAALPYCLGVFGLLASACGLRVWSGWGADGWIIAALVVSLGLFWGYLWVMIGSRWQRFRSLDAELHDAYGVLLLLGGAWCLNLLSAWTTTALYDQFRESAWSVGLLRTNVWIAFFLYGSLALFCLGLLTVAGLRALRSQPPARSTSSRVLALALLVVELGIALWLAWQNLAQFDSSREAARDWAAMLTNSWINLGLIGLLALGWVAFAVVTVRRWHHHRLPREAGILVGLGAPGLAASALGICLISGGVTAAWLAPALCAALVLFWVALLAEGVMGWRQRRPRLDKELSWGLFVFGILAGGLSIELLCSNNTEVAVEQGLLIGLFGLWLVLLIVGFVRAIRRRRPLDELFRMEALAGGLNSRLVSAWDFLVHGPETPLTRAVIGRARDDLAFKFESRLDRRQHDLRRLWFGAATLVFVGLGMIPGVGFSAVHDNLRASWAALQESLFPAEYQVTVEPKGVYVIDKGKDENGKEQPNDKATLTIHFPNREFAKVKLVVSDGKTQRIIDPLPVNDDGNARHVLESDVEAEYAAWFEFGGRASEKETLIFTRRPELVNMQTELVYPAYTRLLPANREGIQQRLVALSGTHMAVAFTFTKELKRAWLAWDDDTPPLPLNTNRRFATVDLLHDRARSATLHVVDRHGLSLKSRVSIDFVVTPDDRPRVELPKHLKEDMPLLEEQVKVFGFSATASDDFGVTKVVLKWQKSTVDNPAKIDDRGEVERLISPDLPKVIVNFEKVFETMPLKPGDKVTFWVEATDNRKPKEQTSASQRCSFFVFQDALGGLSIKELGFGADSEMGRDRIPKATKATAVKAPEGLRTKDNFKADFEASITTGTQAPTVRGEYSQATRDYFRLFSKVKYADEEPPKKK